MNTRIARVADNGGEMFAVDIRRGYLQIVYNLNGTGNGTLNICKLTEFVNFSYRHDDQKNRLFAG